MTPDALFGWMKRHTPPPAAPQCGLCFGKSGHPPLTDEGVLRCVPCLYQRGRWAASPDDLSLEAATALWSAHGDVMELRRCFAHTVEWNWIGWTADPDAIVDPDGAALAFGAALLVAWAHEAVVGGL